MNKELLRVKKVDSSNINAIGFDSLTKTLYIIFKGKTNSLYKYTEFDQGTYERFLETPSKGKFFFKFIKGNEGYKVEKLNFDDYLVEVIE